MARETQERVTVKINGREFSNWSEIEIHDTIDAFSTVTLTAPFDPSRKDMRETFQPFTFKPMQVLLNGRVLFTGTMLDPGPSLSAKESAVNVKGYALAGVLDNCTPPASAFKDAAAQRNGIEFKNLKLGAIANALCEPFGLKAQMRDAEGAAFTRVRIEHQKKILEFLAELARQRNLVISNTPDGMPVFWRSIAPGNPVAHLQGGKQPLVSIEAEFSPLDYYSEITCFAKPTRKRRGSQYTEKNKWLDTFRPFAFRAEDTDPENAPDATRAKLGRMFGNMAAWTIDHLPTWRDPAGDLWEPNTTLNVTAPHAMIYRKCELLIREVILKQNARETTADLKLVLPGAFSGEVPASLPWLP